MVALGEVRALLGLFQRSDLRDLSVRTGGWTIFAAKPGGGSAPGTPTPASLGTTVDAPHLGLFFAATAVGETVAIGDRLGVLRVLDEERPVDSTASGRVTALLVADGATVEFGTPLIGLATH